MTKYDATGWRYFPGIWQRTDGARAERVTTGRRAGVWKAILPGSSPIRQKMILTDGSVGDPWARPDTNWRGYSTAKAAMAALDATLADTNRKIADLMRGTTPAKQAEGQNQ